MLGNSAVVQAGAALGDTSTAAVAAGFVGSTGDGDSAGSTGRLPGEGVADQENSGLSRLRRLRDVGGTGVADIGLVENCIEVAPILRRRDRESSEAEPESSWLAWMGVHGLFLRDGAALADGVDLGHEETVEGSTVLGGCDACDG